MNREPAWRLFAAEYNDVHYEIKAEEEKTPSYLITPLGEKSIESTSLVFLPMLKIFQMMETSSALTYQTQQVSLQYTLANINKKQHKH